MPASTRGGPCRFAGRHQHPDRRAGRSRGGRRLAPAPDIGRLGGAADTRVAPQAVPYCRAGPGARGRQVPWRLPARSRRWVSAVQGLRRMPASTRGGRAVLPGGTSIRTAEPAGLVAAADSLPRRASVAQGVRRIPASPRRPCPTAGRDRERGVGRSRGGRRLAPWRASAAQGVRRVPASIRRGPCRSDGRDRERGVGRSRGGRRPAPAPGTGRSGARSAWPRGDPLRAERERSSLPSVTRPSGRYPAAGYSKKPVHLRWTGSLRRYRLWPRAQRLRQRETLPALMHEVQAFTRFGVPPTTVRTRWMFGFQRRGVRRCECEMLLPKPGPLPQTSQLAATGHSKDFRCTYG